MVGKVVVVGMKKLKKKGVGYGSFKSVSANMCSTTTRGQFSTSRCRNRGRGRATPLVSKQAYIYSWLGAHETHPQITKAI